jgi:hypothetical protein
MANISCTKCGREVVAGKRFCGGCGQALPVTATTVVEGVTAATVFEQPLSAPTPEELPETTAKEPASSVISHAPTVILDSSYAEPFSAEPASTSQWQPVKETASYWTDSSAINNASAPPAEPGDQSTTKIVLLAVGIAAAILVAAGGGWAWYVHVHKGVRGEAGPVAQAPQPTPLPTVQEHASAVPVIMEPISKPPAGVPIPAAPPAQKIPDSHAQSVPIPPRSSSQSGHGKPVAPTPAFHPTPATPEQLPAQNNQGRSGVRHYEGPPVLHGGTVVFDNLPKERLKFAFDHTLWQLTIKPNPDGTKKITMILLAAGPQPSCDLSWEIVE